MFIANINPPPCPNPDRPPPAPGRDARAPAPDALTDAVRRHRFELRAEGDGCVLVLTHAFDERDIAARTAAGWDRCFARLDALFAEQPMSEAASLELWPDVHERYAERFGVDPEIGRPAHAAHPRT